MQSKQTDPVPESNIPVPTTTACLPPAAAGEDVITLVPSSSTSVPIVPPPLASSHNQLLAEGKNTLRHGQTSTAVSSGAVAAGSSSGLPSEKTTSQRSFSRGLRAPANPVAKPPRSFADPRTASAVLVAAATMDQSKSAAAAPPDADWLARISGSSILRQPPATGEVGNGQQRSGTTRKWVKNLPLKMAPGGGKVSSDLAAVPAAAEDEGKEEEVAVGRLKPDAVACLEQLKSSTKSILDQHR